MTQRGFGRFAGTAAVVTGGAHGIGRACASRLAEEGARVAVADLDQDAAKSPAIVNVSSINALTALGSEPYSSAKAGVGSLTINLAAGLAPDGIRVNAVAPATIRTRDWDRQEGGADRLRHLYPLGRVGEAEDAAAVAFLASSDAAWITGHTLPVDGGLLTGPRTL
jgi:meso-butanediol dehydrogenase/(S,S)-butanediol dehydrogenase/diacetyl reductase